MSIDPAANEIEGYAVVAALAHGFSDTDFVVMATQDFIGHLRHAPDKALVFTNVEGDPG